MARGYIKGANGVEVEIVDVTARSVAEGNANVVTIPSAAIPVVDGQIDYTIGETELYVCYMQLNTGAVGFYQMYTELINYKKAGIYQNTGTTDEMWAFPDVRNANTYPHQYCKKLDTSAFETFYAENGVTGTRKLTVEVSNANAVLYDGTNADAANLWILSRPSSIREWLDRFPAVPTPSDTLSTGMRLAMPDALGLYNALDYGISADSADNTLAFQTLVDEINANGGGTIFVPTGTYLFDTAGEHIKLTSAATGSTYCCVKLKNHVSIQGESLTETVFKAVGNSARGVAMFGYRGDAETPLTGCAYETFTVDASEATIDTYSSDGKAIFCQYVKDCIFRDLRLIGTPATAMGNDYLDNVVMDGIYVYNAGRIHADDSPGGAGIGIGTGGFEHENFIVRNCITDSCGHFGIFCEDQALFDRGTPTLRYPKGMTIANNIVRNGRNYGIGLRGGMYALVTGNNVYGNANGGIYLDFGADSSAVVGNLVCGEVVGLCFGDESNYYACNKIAVTGNTFIGCTTDILKTKEPTDSVIENNVTID